MNRKYILYEVCERSSMAEHNLPGAYDNPYKFNAKELDRETGLYYYGARYYNPRLSVWYGVDPLAEKMPSWSPYAYTFDNPVRFIDPDGREPVLPYVGTALMFRALLDKSPRGVGNFKGVQAGNYLRSLGSTEMNWSQMRPLPTQTGYFNKKAGRYIYTEKGGWLDMTHFMFYAGKAYGYKQEKAEAESLLKTMKASGIPNSEISANIKSKANLNPVGEAVQDGYNQETSDGFAAPYSSYSYEDLPSDKFGADFGANYFDPKSKLSFGEQLQNYLNNLGATDPKNAPNYKQLPETEPTDKPTRTNHTTKPVYTK